MSKSEALDPLAEGYLGYMKDVSRRAKGTIKDVRCTLRHVTRVMSELSPDKALWHLPLEGYLRWLEHERQEGRSPRSLAKYVSHLRGLLDYAWRSGRSDRNVLDGFDLQDIGRRFVRWLDEGYWTPHGNVFDIGIATSQAISKLRAGTAPIQAGGVHERSNGNGSLMRILPVALYFANSETGELLAATHEVSCLTHAHPRSQMACGFYSMMIVELLKGKSQQGAYFDAVEGFVDAYNTPPFSSELGHFDRLLHKQIHEEPEDTMNSSGYVIHTLESSVWAFLRSSSFEEAVLSAINLGEDTDTTGAVVGGLAGVYYGLGAIPGKWVEALARSSDVLELCERFCHKIGQRSAQR